MTWDEVERLKELRDQLETGQMVEGSRLNQAEMDEILTILIKDAVDRFYSKLD